MYVLSQLIFGGHYADEQEMTTYDALFKTIEEYKDITVDALTYSKIGKGELLLVSAEGNAPALVLTRRSNEEDRNSIGYTPQRRAELHESSVNPHAERRSRGHSW